MQPIVQNLGMNVLLILLTATVLVIGAVLIHRARQDLVSSCQEDLGRDPLAVYREAFRRGQMDFAEYQRIVDRFDRQRKGAGGPLPAVPIPPKGDDAGEPAAEAPASDGTATESDSGEPGADRPTGEHARSDA